MIRLEFVKNVYKMNCKHEETTVLSSVKDACVLLPNVVS